MFNNEWGISSGQIDIDRHLDHGLFFLFESIFANDGLVSKLYAFVIFGSHLDMGI